MKNTYLIIKRENNISLYECGVDASILPIKNKGEKEQVYNPNKFWEWFTEKIGYQNELLSFIVLNDNDDFSVPDIINLSEIHHLQTDELCKRKIEQLAEKYKLLSFPQIQNFTIQKKKQETLKIDKEIVQNLEKYTLADIFNQRTQEYKNAKR